MDRKHCFICRSSAEIEHPGDYYRVRCEICGPYEIVGTAVAMLPSRLVADKRAAARASHAIRMRTSEDAWLGIHSMNLDALLSEKLPPPDKQLALLIEWLKRESGDEYTSPIPVNRCALVAIVGAASVANLEVLLKGAVSEGLIAYHAGNDRIGLTLKAFAGGASEAPTRPDVRKSVSQEGSTDNQDARMATAFMSYSWDDDAHKDWVRELAARLRGLGVDVTLDQWHVVPGDQLPQFMETAVRDSDFVLIVCTPRYKDRSDKRAGGVGYEGDIITAEVMTQRNQRKFIPILRRGTWNDAAPSWLSGKYHLDLSADPYSEAQFQDLLNTLQGTRPKAPPLGKAPSGGSAVRSAAVSPAPSIAFVPLRITGVVVDEVGAPRNDGTRGSALYDVPFQLSQNPPAGWGEMFVRNWDQPPSWTTMHRPGIASVRGDRIILDGTTVDEVERVHRHTLVLALNETNKQFVEADTLRQAAEDAQRRRAEEHKRNVSETAKRLKFDDN